MSQSDWAVAAIARESPEVIRRFVSWHLDLGASAITIYFDDPNDPSIAMLAHLPQVQCVPCTADFWTSLGIEPNRPFVRRQNRALQLAYDTCAQPWLFICDADELLYFDGTVISDFLDAQSTEVRTILFQAAERVIVEGRETDTYVRLYSAKPALTRIYGAPLATALQMRGGMVGHDFGKSITRTGLPGISVRQHFVETAPGKPMLDLRIGWKHGAALLHLMHRGYEDWRQKLPMRMAGFSIAKTLKPIIAPMLAAGDETGLRALHDQLFLFRPDRLRIMKEEGAVTLVLPDPDHAVGRYFPGEARPPA